MNNLKRVLSLLLAVIMLVGIMALGASALTVEDFSDADTIAADKSEAVQGTVALSIINGLPDGSFDPDGIVTREQAAKMIYVAKNGGRDNANLTKRNPAMFTDVTNWAQGYVEWCAVQGIIAGRGDGTFDPQGELTATALAKLLLVAIGYNAKIEHLENDVDWAIYTNSLANNNDFYDGLEDIDPNAPMSREDAAQMIWNACHADMVEYDGGLTVDANNNLTANNKVKKINNGGVTLLGTGSYKLKEYTAFVTKATYDADNGDWDYDLTSATNKFGNTAASFPVGTTFTTTSLTDIADDYSALFGKKVTVLATSATANKVTGIISSDSTVLVEGVVGKLPTIAADATSVKYDGTTYNLDNAANSIKVYEFNKYNSDNGTNVTLNAYKNAGVNTHYAFQLIDNDGNGQVNAVVVYPVSVETVASVASTTIRTNVTGTVNKADVDLYDGVAKNDVVTVTDPATGEKVVYEKLDVAFTGKVTATKAGQISVDGTWYTVDSIAPYTIGHTYDFYTINDWIVKAVDKDDTTSTDVNYALLIGAQAANTFNGTPNQVKLLKSDNSTEVVTAAYDYTAVTTPADAAAVKSALDPSTSAYPLVTYTVSSGKYTLTLAANNSSSSADKAEDKTGFASVLNEGSFSALTEPADGKLAGVDIANDAVIFTKQSPTSGDTWSIITGAALKKYAAGSVTAASNVYASKNTNGFTEVKLAYVTLNTTTKIATRNYGYVTSGLTNTEDGTVLSFFNADGQQDDIVASSIASGVAAGSVIKYTLGDNGKYTIEQSDASLGKVTAWDGKKIEITDGAANVTTSTVDAETVVFYIDSSKKVGTDGDIALAAAAETDAAGKTVITGYNVYFVATNGGHADVLIVDVNSNLVAAVGSTATVDDSGAVTAAKITTALASNDNVTVDTAELSEAPTVAVASGKTLTLTGTPASQLVTVTLNKGTLVIDETATLGTHVALDASAEGTIEIKGAVTNSAGTEAAIASDLQAATKTVAAATADVTDGTITAPKIALKGAGSLESFSSGTSIDSFIAASKSGSDVSTNVGLYQFDITLADKDNVKMLVSFDGTNFINTTVSEPLKTAGYDKSGAGSETFTLLLGNAVQAVRFVVAHDGGTSNTLTYTIER